MAEAYERTLSLVKTNPVLTGVLATAVVGAAWTVNDFLAWKAFGTGGTPPTWAGYWRMTKLRLNHLLRGPDLLDHSTLSTSTTSYLSPPLRQRTGARPKIVSRLMPQRQVPEPLDAALQTRVQTLVQTLQSQHADLLEIKPSHTEGRSTDGLYARKDVPGLNSVANDRLLDHEIAHAHPADNSLHVWLSESDAREVVRLGWGQRFPLPAVHKGWTMVYAPRDLEEVEVVEEIVKAGVGWITGQRI